MSEAPDPRENQYMDVLMSIDRLNEKCTGQNRQRLHKARELVAQALDTEQGIIKEATHAA